MSSSEIVRGVIRLSKEQLRRFVHALVVVSRSKHGQELTIEDALAQLQAQHSVLTDYYIKRFLSQSQGGFNKGHLSTMCQTILDKSLSEVFFDEPSIDDSEATKNEKKISTSNSSINGQFILPGIHHLTETEISRLSGTFLVHGIEELCAYDNHTKDKYLYYRSILKIEHGGSELLAGIHPEPIHSMKYGETKKSYEFQLGRIEAYDQALFACITSVKDGLPFYLFGFLDVVSAPNEGVMPFTGISEMKRPGERVLLEPFIPYSGFAMINKVSPLEPNFDELINTPLRNENEEKLLNKVKMTNELKRDIQKSIKSLKDRANPIVSRENGDLD